MDGVGPETTPVTPPDAVATAAPAERQALDLDCILKEFDAAQTPAEPSARLGEEQPPPSAAPAPPKADPAATPADINSLLNDAVAGYHSASLTQSPEAIAELRGKIGDLANAVAAGQAERAEAANKTDWDNIIKMGREAVADFDHVPEDFAEMWLRSESTRNHRLRESFDRRYESKDALHFAERQMKKAMQSLYKAAQSFPDRSATETRAAVTAAVRGASSMAPPEKPIRYGDLTDAEFAKEKARLGV